MAYHTVGLLSQYDQYDDVGDDHAPALRGALLAAAVGLTTFAVTATLAMNGHVLDRSLDAPLRRRIPGIGGPVRRGRRLRSPVVETLAGLGGKWMTNAAAVAGAAAVARREPRRAAPVLATAATSLALQLLLKPIVQRPRPLLARLTGKRSSSFPSGHALRGASVFGVLAHAAVRERLAPASIAYPLAAIAALTTGAARVAQDRHWVTDLVGGWGLGAALAAGGAAWYDRVRA